MSKPDTKLTTVNPVATTGHRRDAVTTYLPTLRYKAPGLHWRQRLHDWAGLIRRQHGRVSWLAMLRALSTGPVPREVWQDRIRVCARCPIRTPGAWVCHRKLSDGREVGCGCDLVFTCLAAAPYKEGCWARMKGIDREGWPAHKFKSRRHKFFAFFKFFCGR